MDMILKKKRLLRKILFALLAAVLGMLTAACTSDDDDASDALSLQEETSQASDDDSDEGYVAFDSMDTYMTITVYGSNAQSAAEAAEAEIERLDGILSAESEGSEVYEINENGGGTLSSDCAFLIDVSLKLWEATGGAFDISIYPVSVLWGFTTGDYAVPSDEDLAAALSLTGSSRLDWDADTCVLSMEEGMAVTLGGIAKGYSGDLIMDIFEEYGVDGAIASLGGNIVVYGSKPSGDLWKIAIQDPEDSASYICVLSLEGNTNVITSGGYERYFEEDGVTYHHILDPATGYPAQAGLTSVSIITENGTEGDGLSTALFVMGLEEAIEFWRSTDEYDFEMVLVDEEKNVYITEGLADSYSSDYAVTIISR